MRFSMYIEKAQSSSGTIVFNGNWVVSQTPRGVLFFEYVNSEKIRVQIYDYWEKTPCTIRFGDRHIIVAFPSVKIVLNKETFGVFEMCDDSIVPSYPVEQKNPYEGMGVPLTRDIRMWNSHGLDIGHGIHISKANRSGCSGTAYGAITVNDQERHVFTVPAHFRMISMFSRTRGIGLTSDNILQMFDITDQHAKNAFFDFCPLHQDMLSTVWQYVEYSEHETVRRDYNFDAINAQMRNVKIVRRSEGRNGVKRLPETFTEILTEAHEPSTKRQRIW